MSIVTSKNSSGIAFGTLTCFFNGNICDLIILYDLKPASEIFNLLILDCNFASKYIIMIGHI